MEKQPHLYRDRIAANPLATRGDFAQLLCDLAEPLAAHTSPGGAFVRLGEDAAWYERRVQWLEGFARPLWGLAPLHAGGGQVRWERLREGLAHGCDPQHPEYWGAVGDGDQRAVEMAAIGYALALAPDALWDPLPPQDRARIGHWLGRIQAVKVIDNNWHFFPVIASLGLERVGLPFNQSARDHHLDWIERMVLGHGWYRDGAGQVDHYNGFAFHFYGLLYARLAGARDPQRARRFTERAAEFAPGYARWFGDDGACLAMGRSLTYRFATAAFWGALAFADVQALPWAQLRGLWARQIRWWMRQPMLDAAGLLSVGYGWPNALASEQYTTSASPYWAFKAFLPLALPDAHPFWRADEAPHPGPPGATTVAPASMLVNRWEGDAVVLPAGPPARQVRNGPDKYAKFAYTSRFGLAVEAARWIPMGYCGDNILALSEDGKTFHARETLLEARTGQGWIETRWSPLAGVSVTSLQMFIGSWELRLHRIHSPVALRCLESGHAVAAALERTGLHQRSDEAAARDGHLGIAVGDHGMQSALLNVLGRRRCLARHLMPNTHLLHARAVVPVLAGRLAAGTCLLATGVRASADAGARLAASAQRMREAAQPLLQAAGWELP